MFALCLGLLTLICEATLWVILGKTHIEVLFFFFFSFGVCFVTVCAQQCNPGDLRALRKGMTLYHSESQLSSLPQRQEAMHMVSNEKTDTHAHIRKHTNLEKANHLY